MCHSCQCAPVFIFLTVEAGKHTGNGLRWKYTQPFFQHKSLYIPSTLQKQTNKPDMKLWTFQMQICRVKYIHPESVLKNMHVRKKNEVEIKRWWADSDVSKQEKEETDAGLIQFSSEHSSRDSFVVSSRSWSYITTAFPTYFKISVWAVVSWVGATSVNAEKSLQRANWPRERLAACLRFGSNAVVWLVRFVSLHVN